jgi:hypothetical protein
MTRRRRSKGLSKQDKRGLMILALAVATVVAILALSFVVRDDSKYDARTLCPINRPYARTIVIVDKTDPFTSAQSAFLRAEILRLRADMEQSEKLAIYILREDNFAAPTPVFELCNPGTGAEANALYQNPKKIRLHFEERFGKPLDAILANLVKGERSEQSPIIEMIKSVAYRGDFDEQGVKLQLVLISDMLQHTRGILPLPDVPRFPGPGGQRLLPPRSHLAGGRHGAPDLFPAPRPGKAPDFAPHRFLGGLFRRRRSFPGRPQLRTVRAL